VTEFCNGGNLEEYRKKKPNKILSENEIQFVFRQICKGYDFLYTQGKYIHRDLKPENILIIDHSN
jgi:serine/threonine protein kinase